jgi:flagellar motor switch protein FliN
MNETNSTPAAELVELPEIAATQATGPALLGNMRALQGVKVNLSVLVGHAQTTLGNMMQLKDGSVLAIDREVDSPVDVMLDGEVVARGQLVVVGDHFGVRITDVASHAA